MLKVGIIGAGMMACGYDHPLSKDILTHVHAIIKSTDFLIKGIYDIDEEKRKIAGEKWNIRYVDSIKKLIEECDIICCATSDATHYEVLLYVLDNCRDVKAIICEKPIATSLADAVELTKRCALLGISLFVNYSRRFMSGFQKVKDMIPDLGRLIVGNCYYGKGLFHNCSHMINILDFIIDLSVFNRYEILKKTVDHDENDPSVDFIMFSESGSIFFHTIPCDVTTVFQFELFFEHGRIGYDDSEETIKIYDIEPSYKFGGYTNYRLKTVFSAGRNEALPNLYTNVLEAISYGNKSISDGKSATNTLRYCDIIESLI